MSKIKRNDPCPCKSGKKYKKCCGAGFSLSKKEIKPLSGATTSNVAGLFSKISASSSKAATELKEKEVTSKPEKKD